VLRPRAGGPCHLSRCCSALHFTVPSGCYALVTEHGADLDYVDDDENASAAWPAGLHYPYPPWVRVSHLVTKQSVVLDMPVKACRTRDNVAVNVDVALVFRIMGDSSRGEDPGLVRRFVHEVKPRGLEQQLRDAQEEAIRTLARSMRHTEIYGIRSGMPEEREDPQKEKNGSFLRAEDAARRALVEAGTIGGHDDDELDFDEDDPLLGGSDIEDRWIARGAITRGKRVTAAMRDRLNRQFIPQGVQILSVAIKQITLPDNIVSQMSERTMVVSQTAQQIMQHEYDMQNERMEQEVQTLLQSYRERREQEVAAGKEAMNVQRVRLNDAVSQATKAEAELREDAEIKVQTIHAGNELVIQRIRNKIFKETTRIESDARKYCAELLATIKLEAQGVLSEADLRSAENIAMADTLLSEAEGKMAPWLEKKREHTTQLKRLKVYEQVGESGLILGATDDDEENVVAVADAILRNEDGGGEEPDPRCSLMAEVALLNASSAALISHTKEE